MAFSKFSYESTTYEVDQLSEKLKEARNSFVGRAQTGFQFSCETQKLKQTKLASRSRLDLIFCTGLLKAACRQG